MRRVRPYAICQVVYDKCRIVQSSRSVSELLLIGIIACFRRLTLFFSPQVGCFQETFRVLLRKEIT